MSSAAYRAAEAARPNRAAHAHPTIARGSITRPSRPRGTEAQCVQLHGRLRAQGAAAQHAQARG
eukprot:3090181-Alexandrium_andersonii.AAC.1